MPYSKVASDRWLAPASPCGKTPIHVCQLPQDNLIHNFVAEALGIFYLGVGAGTCRHLARNGGTVFWLTIPMVAINDDDGILSCKTSSPSTMVSLDPSA